MNLRNLTFRWMEPSDVETVGQLARRIWNAHYPSVVSQAQIDFMLDDRYSPQSLLAQMAEGQRFLLASEETEIVGFLSVSPLDRIQNPILRGVEEATAADWF